MIVILGGGLAGLSTAFHLGEEPHLVLEAGKEPGGLCTTREIEGFHFDRAGHLLHLRDSRAIEFVDNMLPGAFNQVKRRAYVRTGGVSVPFPFQANLYGLPPDVVTDCLVEFVKSLGRPVPDDPAASFEEWSLAVMGRGISERFMFPYNTKLFRREPSEMTADWVSWAVPRPSLEEVIRGAVGRVDHGMGYNVTFRYPKQGGIGCLPRAMAGRVKNLRCGTEVVAVDPESASVTTAAGERIGYDRLVVTIPLPKFLEMLPGEPEHRLDWSVVACLNIAVDRAGIGDGAHWIYFPDGTVPFYRVGFPTNFSGGVAPPGTSSMYIEFGLEKDEPLDALSLEAEAIAALRREGILQPRDRVLLSDMLRIDPGYVVFDRHRRKLLADVMPRLQSRGIDLIGRYGAWTYSYMERAILDGMETAEKLLTT